MRDDWLKQWPDWTCEVMDWLAVQGDAYQTDTQALGAQRSEAVVFPRHWHRNEAQIACVV